jgi:molecular chaperone Hsp33
MNNDAAQRFLFEQSDVRGEFVSLDESFMGVVLKRQYPVVIRQFLGELLVSAVLLTSTLKFEGELTIQLEVGGDVSLLVAKCNDQLCIRGLAQWEDGAITQQLCDDFDKGKLVITVQPARSTQYYQSIVPVEGRSVAQAIEHYFEQSEQLPTRLWLTVSGDKAAGMLLQKLPSSISEDDDEYWNHVVTLAETLSPQDIVKLDNVEILHRLYHAEDIRVFDKKGVKFSCTCSVQRMEKAILTLGSSEASEMLLNREAIQVVCEFCGHAYEFDHIDISDIFSRHGGDKLH